MALLTKAAGTGYRNAASFRTNTALDPLRNRPDFQLLMMDLAFPAQPDRAVRRALAFARPCLAEKTARRQNGG